MDSFHELFNKRNKFCQQIECLMSSMNRINDDLFIRKRLDQLKISIENCMKNSGRVFIYGSRLYGLAKDDSDVDLYVDTGDCFSGKIANDYTRQIQLIELFVNAANEEFVELEIITTTRIPIMRFLHGPTKFKCDLNFRSGIAVLNSELVKLYLSIDERVRWVVIAVKHWAVTFNLVSDNFSSFSIIWLVLFVMMKYQIVPPIIDLWKMHRNHEPNYIEDWDTRICFNNEQLTSIIPSKSNHTKWELLRYVFEFYSDSNSNTLQNYVLCTIFGELLPKKTFYSTFISKSKTIDNYFFQIETFKKFKTLVNKNFGSSNRIELQNPLKLCNNVIPWLSDENMKLFISVCTKSANSMSIL